MTKDLSVTLPVEPGTLLKATDAIAALLDPGHLSAGCFCFGSSSPRNLGFIACPTRS